MQDIREQRIYCAEQIYVPDNLPIILKHYSKAVIRANPNNLIDFSIEYFETQCKNKENLGRLSDVNIEKPDETEIKP